MIQCHLKWEYEKELTINTLEYVQHDNCIEHCLKFAFGDCNEQHLEHCEKCSKVDSIFHQILQILPNEKEKIIENRANYNIIGLIKLEKLISTHNSMQHYFVWMKMVLSL